METTARAYARHGSCEKRPAGLGGKRRRRTARRQERRVAEDDRGRRWREGGFVMEWPNLKLGQRPNQHLPIRDELDDALVIRLT